MTTRTVWPILCRGLLAPALSLTFSVAVAQVPPSTSEMVGNLPASWAGGIGNGLAVVDLFPVLNSDGKTVLLIAWGTFRPGTYGTHIQLAGGTAPPSAVTQKSPTAVSMNVDISALIHPTWLEIS